MQPVTEACASVCVAQTDTAQAVRPLGTAGLVHCMISHARSACPSGQDLTLECCRGRGALGTGVGKERSGPSQALTERPFPFGLEGPCSIARRRGRDGAPRHSGGPGPEFLH